MKIKKGYVLKEIGDSCVVVPIGEAAKTFKGVIALNETAKVLWLTLEKGADLDGLVDALTAEYEVDRETALRSCEKFLEKLKTADVIEY
ncbi:MAG: PqqD family protein [Clostridia bacterium]|nr:PqqD family protein [Clostridia bacterium]